MNAKPASVDHCQKYHYSHYQAGQGLVEYALVLVIMSVILVVLVSTLFRYPDIAEKGLMLAVVGGVIASIAWSVKQTIAAETNHIQLRILELLSNGEPLSREDLKRRLCQERWLLKLLPEICTDALAELVRQDKVAIATEQKYTLARG